MSENIKNTAAESAQNAAGAAEAVTHDMTVEAVNEPVQADAGVYTVLCYNTDQIGQREGNQKHHKGIEQIIDKSAAPDKRTAVERHRRHDCNYPAFLFRLACISDTSRNNLAILNADCTVCHLSDFLIVRDHNGGLVELTADRLHQQNNIHTCF